MQKTERTMMLAVLSKLFEHLREYYDIEWTPDDATDDAIIVHQIDAAIAFKSDSVLEELRSAMFRLEEGTFGVCIHCKSLIAEDVLRVDPTQRLCSVCEHALADVVAGDMRARADGKGLHL